MTTRSYYPTVTTANYKRWDNITDEDLEKDIADTQQEIAGKETQIAQLEAAEKVGSLNRLDDVRLAAYRSGVEDRKHFVAFLLALKKERGL